MFGINAAKGIVFLTLAVVYFGKAVATETRNLQFETS